jgi:mRNA interferase RelE/StbE
LKLVRYAKTGAGDVKSLSGREGARLRVGDWRVIFTEDPTTIIVVAVGHRGEIYESAHLIRQCRADSCRPKR